MKTKEFNRTPADCNIAENTIIGPRLGWIPQIYYVVEIAMNEFNPVFRAIFFCGFLHKGMPGSYSGVMSASGDVTSIEDLYYCRVIRSLNVND